MKIIEMNFEVKVGKRFAGFEKRKGGLAWGERGSPKKCSRA